MTGSLFLWEISEILIEKTEKQKQYNIQINIYGMKIGDACVSQPVILVSMADIYSQDFILRPVTQHRHPISKRAGRLHERRHKTNATRRAVATLPSDRSE